MAKWTFRSSVAVVLLVFTCMRCLSNADTKHAYFAETNSGSADVDGLDTTKKNGAKTQISEECIENSDTENCLTYDELGEDNHQEKIVVSSSEFGSDEISEIKWDTNGYILFCPCMGRFGNQAEHYIGAMAFAKAVNRTLVMPPFRTFAHASFGELFQVEPVHEFHRIILMEDFMEKLAPKYWPPGKRAGYAHLPEKTDILCTIKSGNPFEPFWNHFNIDFDECIKYQLHNFADITDESSLKKNETNVGCKERTCEHSKGMKRFMASPQCLDKTPEAVLTKDMCLPSLPHLLQLTSDVFNHVNAKHLFIATDKNPYTEELRNLLQPRGVTVHYLNPDLVEMDLMILGQADYFIGNCVSSFTSFVKRERDANGKPSTFWGQDLKF